jgi:LacI family transcriptional regulator
MDDQAAHVRNVKDYVRARILRAELVEGHRVESRDVRQATGESVRAVRQALSELAREGVLKRRQKTGTVVAGGIAGTGITPLPAVRSVAVLSSRSIDEINNTRFTRDILVGVQRGLSQPRRIEWCVNTPGLPKSVNMLPAIEAEVLRSLAQGVVGIEANHTGRLNALTRAGLPTVAVDYNPRDAAFDVVFVDHEDAGFQVTSHLLALGHRRIAFVGERANPQSSDPSWQDRMCGYLRAMAWAGSEFPAPLVLGGPRDPTRLKVDLPGFHQRNKPTAYVLASGNWAEEVMRVLGTLNVKCPQDVSIANADGSTPKVHGMAMTEVRGDYEEAGELAIQAIGARLMCRAMPAARYRVPVLFVPGESTRTL